MCIQGQYLNHFRKVICRHVHALICSRYRVGSQTAGINPSIRNKYYANPVLFWSLSKMIYANADFLRHIPFVITINYCCSTVETMADSVQLTQGGNYANLAESFWNIGLGLSNVMSHCYENKNRLWLFRFCTDLKRSRLIFKT